LRDCRRRLIRAAERQRGREMKKVVMYQTTDGDRHESVEAALEHVDEIVHRELYDLLCGAACKHEAAGFIGNYAKRFTEYLASNIHRLDSIVSFYNDNREGCEDAD
jgi:hypothetical protein